MKTMPIRVQSTLLNSYQHFFLFQTITVEHIIKINYSYAVKNLVFEIYRFMSWINNNGEFIFISRILLPNAFLKATMFANEIDLCNRFKIPAI